jgi:hypothetical protein
METSNKFVQVLTHGLRAACFSFVLFDFESRSIFSSDPGEQHVRSRKNRSAPSKDPRTFLLPQSMIRLEGTSLST